MQVEYQEKGDALPSSSFVDFLRGLMRLCALVHQEALGAALASMQSGRARLQDGTDLMVYFAGAEPMFFAFGGVFVPTGAPVFEEDSGRLC